ncbi:MAG: hypothetical protein LZF86_80041 [Nitrospira sp.]|nr:MAG: hypothetical protein LZF86_80041 [Nitrospira sp.]
MNRRSPAYNFVYNFFRMSFHSFATLALRGASPFAGSGTITASNRR